MLSAEICQLLIQSAVHTSSFQIATTFLGNMLVHKVTRRAPQLCLQDEFEATASLA